MNDYPADILEKARAVRVLTCADAECTFDAGCGCLEAIAQALMEERERWQDKVDGLESDLSNAVETAFKRGANEWTRLNYPRQYERLAAAIRSGWE